MDNAILQTENDVTARITRRTLAKRGAGYAGEANGGSTGDGPAGRHSASVPLAELLHEPFARLGSTTPDLDASLAAHATLGKLSDHLRQHTTPAPAEIAHITRFCLKAVQTH